MGIEIMYATEFPEFFDKETDKLLEEGQHIGFDVDTEDGVELVLLDNVYWSPQYDNAVE